MFEDPQCIDCELASRARTRCMPSLGGRDCKLAIFLDYPAVVEDRRGLPWIGDNAEFVNWCLARMGVSLKEVYRDYIIKCYPEKMPGKKENRMTCVRACAPYRLESLRELQACKALVVLGGLGCEVMTHDVTIGHKQGMAWTPVSPVIRQQFHHVWVGYSPGIIREKPSEAGTIFRVIWRAAEEAGLNPTVHDIPPYEFKIGK